MGTAPLGKILIAVDATEASLAAARYGIAIAGTYGAELHAVYVVNEKLLEELVRAKVFVEAEEVDLEADLEEDGKRYLSYVEKLARDKNVSVTTELLKGIVHRQIVDKATQIGATLIIIGEIEEPLSRKDAFYDEGEMVLRRAGCPVLMVKGESLVDDVYDSL
jgi:nucleotide-binding universal stress UspA family protein